MLFPIADHGDVISTLPFVAPALLIVIGLLVLVLRDRLRREK
jgi:phosphate starvation-inducible membrane PsiE